ncbi:DUF1819 family protein [Caldibacillus debilis]|uniref:DUF1819 family protein n=1 Tax=Caldibacillus debilis TaxID=301148 RepID=UPI001F2F56FF|nr:DUF1819 family protein [Caldibacillus debilis]
MNQTYSARMTGDMLLKKEMEYVLREKLQGKSIEQIKRTIIEENVFQYRTKETLNRVLRTIFDRIQYIDDELAYVFLHGVRQDVYAILLFSFLMANRLPREFVMEVVRYHYINQKRVITDGVINAFFERKEEESEDVRNWNIATKKKVRQVLLRILVECQLLKKEEQEWRITPILISQRLRELVKKDDTKRLLLKFVLDE